MQLTLDTTRTLNNGIKIPLLGFGTYKLAQGKETQEAVLAALKLGYRHIDTATIYLNEADVGNAIKNSGIPRKEIFLTTKLWNDDHDDPAKALQESLRKFGTDYVDLYLMHWPVTGKRLQTWKVMEQLYQQKKCRAIGVCNFTIRHLKELLGSAKVIPAVNQVEFSPFWYRKELRELCEANGIQLEGWSPLGRGRKLEDERLLKLAKKYQKKPAQLLLRWALQHEIVTIPKSSHAERIRENMQIFDFAITSADMKMMDSWNEDYRTGTLDPEGIP
ncbi:aldo/keto reductase [Candidatus Woesearchaeota archaeon]|nr:aldo/keto reductase [Candidatus Woesearchaeota archaeon]